MESLLKCEITPHHHHPIRHHQKSPPTLPTHLPYLPTYLLPGQAEIV